MAYLISGPSDHDWTATAWGAVCAGTGAQQTTVSGFQNLGTSWLLSQQFTGPAGNVVDGILVQVGNLNSTTGTVSLCLSEDGGSTETRTCVVDAVDLPDYTSGQCFVFFKFSSPLTLDGGTDYVVGLKANGVNGTIYAARNATISNWWRLLRLTTLAAAGAGDICYVTAELTGQGTGNDRVVTFDETVASRGNPSTDYGGLVIAGGKSVYGKVAWATAASTNYAMKQSGNIEVMKGGIWQRGTVESPIPASSTADLVFDCGSSVQYGFTSYLNAIVMDVGIVPDVPWTTLAEDVSGGATSLVSSVPTGWPSGGTVALAPTDRNANHRESKVMSGPASGTTIPIAALTYGHSGTAPTQGHIALLDRNVMTRGADSSNTAYVYHNESAAVTMVGVEMKWMGSGSSGKRGVGTRPKESVGGLFSADGCSFHDFRASSYGIQQASGSSGEAFSVTNCVFYCPLSTAPLLISSADSGAPEISGCLFIGSGGNGLYLLDASGTITDNIAAGCHNDGIIITEDGAALGVFSGNTAYSNDDSGVSVVSVASGVIEDTIAWRNGESGIQLSGVSQITVDNAVVFGNEMAGIELGTALCIGITLVNVAVDSDDSYAQPVGLILSAAVLASITDSALGGETPHSTSDIVVLSDGVPVDLFLSNTVLGSTTEIANSAYMTDTSVIRSHQHDQTSGAHKCWMNGGIVQRDAVIYRSAPSSRLVPSSASVKLEHATPYGRMLVAVPSGETASPSVWVRKSKSSDGAAYNGNQPRLIVKANSSAGITSDTVLATAAGGYGVWEQLSGTTPAVAADCLLEIVVDCDGTAGWVNVDDWGDGATTPDTWGMSFWADAESPAILANDQDLLGLAYWKDGEARVFMQPTYTQGNADLSGPKVVVSDILVSPEFVYAV